MGVEGVQSVCEGGTRFLERKLRKELYTAVAGLFGLYGFVFRGFLMGLCAAIQLIPADKMGAIQILRKGGDGSQGPLKTSGGSLPDP